MHVQKISLSSPGRAAQTSKERVALGQRREISREVLHAEPRSAVDHDNRVPAAAHESVKEPHALAGVDVTLPDRRRDRGVGRGGREQEQYQDYPQRSS
jgi:hypothetical protein